MAGIVIINGSPRAPRSNSKRYIALFERYCKRECAVFEAAGGNHREIWKAAEACDDILLVFPLYIDGIPATLLELLKSREMTGTAGGTKVHAVVNCGFLEPEQNAVALKMVGLFCRKNGLLFGSSLCIGGGEAILDTPFAPLVKFKLKRLAGAVHSGRDEALLTTMPISKGMYVRASTSYWIGKAKANGLTREQAATTRIE